MLNKEEMKSFLNHLIYDEEFKKEEVTKKSEGQQIPKETTSKNVKKVEKKSSKERRTRS